VQPRLERLLQLRQEPLGRIAEHRDLVQHLDHFVLEPGVEPVGPQAVEVVGQPPTRGQIDILLSLSTTSSFFFKPPALFIAS
jgi:hypothetical protein